MRAVRKKRKKRPVGTSQSKVEKSREAVAFAVRLAEARKRKFDTMKEFADKIGIEAERYRYWERGQREPDICHLVKIARELDVSLDYLILGHLPSYRGRKLS